MDDLIQAIEEHGSIRAAARALGINESTALMRMKRARDRGWLAEAGFELPYMKREDETPPPRGRVEARGERTMPLPPPGMVNRYILTSAQNDTALMGPVWETLQQLLSYWQRDDPRCHTAELMVSRFAYRNFDSEDKAGWAGHRRRANKLTWDPALTPYLVDDRVRLANKLVFCGEMNLSPTASNPIATLEAYTGSASAIFPHPRLVMRSAPSVGFRGAKLLHTTGTVTQRNYIQRKAGLAAEFHHCYGALVAEVDSDGEFWVRQLNSTDEGVIHDLQLSVTPQGVAASAPPLSIYMADLHPEELDEPNYQCTLDLIKTLRPEACFIGDVMSVRLSHHNRGDHFKRFALTETRDNNLMCGVTRCARALWQLVQTARPNPVFIVRSNHDDHLLRWLTEEDGHKDPVNALLWHKMSIAVLNHIIMSHGREDWVKLLNPVELALRCEAWDVEEYLTWLGLDQVHNIAGINHGAHGHAGPRGSRGSPQQFAKLGRKGNYGHFHTPGIWDGAYIAGTHGRHLYSTGPSSSACANILTHVNGKRQIIVNWNGKWRA